MKIEKIRLENFRQYRQQEINFPVDEDERHFVIIQGANGTGKTNILNAVHWCLYADEMDITDKNRGKPLVNDIVLNSLKEGDEITVKVEIFMKDNENRKVVFTRTKKFQKKGHLLCKPVIDTSANSDNGTTLLIIQEKEPYNLKPIHGDLDEVINRNFPKEISRYFLFNGEILDKYFREPTDIKKEIFNLSQLEILEWTVTHLLSCVREMSNELRHSNPEVNEILELKERTSRKLKENENKIETLSVEKEKCGGIIRDLQERLKNSSSEQIKRLEEEREQHKKDIQQLEEERKEEEGGRFEYFIGIMPKIMAYKAISKTLKTIKEKRDSGEFPPLVTKEFLADILKKGKCICGNDISKKNDAQDRIKNLLVTFQMGRELTTAVGNVEQRLNSIANDIKNFKDLQVKYSSKIKELEEKIKQKHIRLEKISQQIGSSDVEQIRRWEFQLTDVEKDREDKIYALAKVRTEISELKKEINTYDEQYKKELKKIHKNERLRNKLLFCQEAQENLGKMKEEIMEEIRSSVQKATEEQFSKLIWKKNSYSNVNIDENYNISVTDITGGECVGTLSAGERQVLALSFMSALNTVSGFHFPIVIDTPLGRISEVPKANIAKNLHDFLKGRQVILLVTEVEYSKEVKELLRNSVCKEYFLKFSEKDLGSEVEVIENV